jgi:hypothetical protein
LDKVYLQAAFNPTVSVTMEAETQTEEEQVNIIEPSDPITPMNIGNFAPGTDSMDSDAEIENHERQLEHCFFIFFFQEILNIIFLIIKVI